MNKMLQAVDFSTPVGNVEAYIARVNAIPMLTAEEEKELAQRWFKYQDVDAARQLTLAHLKFVVKVANTYSGYGLCKADLIQEGNIGLMKAVKRFDPDMGVRLVSFAVHWIKSEIHEYVIKNWRIVKVATTKAQRKLFFNLRKMRKRLGWFSENEINEVAQTLGVKPQEVKEMEARLNAHDTAFDISPDDSDDDSSTKSLGYAPVQYLTCENSIDPAEYWARESWQERATTKLQQALEGLDERSLDIIKSRWLGESKVTLAELAQKYDVSIERIRQLEAKLLENLKEELEDHV